MLRISFTLLSLWEKNKDEAVAYYLGAKKEPTKAMLKGKDYDEFISGYIEKYNKLPESLNSLELTKEFINQRLYEYEEDDVKYVFVPDLIDNKTLFEFKTGYTDIGQYLSSMQIPVYLYLLSKVGIEIDKAFLINEKQGWYYIANNEKIRNKGKKWLEDNTKELASYFKELCL